MWLWAQEAQAEVSHVPSPYDSSPTPPPGRTSFYEEYGVIRDVLQNHLTEVLTLVAMELPVNTSSPEAVLQHKLQAFQALRGLQRGQDQRGVCVRGALVLRRPP